MDAPRRHVNSEMHSSVDDHHFPSFRPGSHFRISTENDAFKGSNLRVIGISSDSVEEQDAFVKKQKLTVSSSNVQPPTIRQDSEIFVVPSVERLYWGIPQSLWSRKRDIGSRRCKGDVFHRFQGCRKVG